jgi:CHAT domain-containing protein/tetratricopeptide (TPR) repeat protein
MVLGRLMLALLMCSGAPGLADDSAHKAFAEAEREFAAGRWSPAERLYRRAAQTDDPALGVSCHQRLVDICSRLGRLDRAIQSGVEARRILEHSGSRDGLRQIDLRLGEMYFNLGHHAEAYEHLELALGSSSALPPLAPLARLSARVYLARAADSLARTAELRGYSTARNARDQADRHWAGVERDASALLVDWELPLTAPDRVEVAWALTDAYRYQKRPEPAIRCLRALRPMHDRLHDRTGKRDTLRRLAAHHALRSDHRRAEACLIEALQLHQQVAAGDLVLLGDLNEELADAVREQHRPGEAAGIYKMAEQAWKAAAARRRSPAEVIDAYWKLNRLYQQKMGDQGLGLALSLAQGEVSRWSGSGLMDPRLRAELGTLLSRKGRNPAARVALREAVDELAKQRPINFIDLPRAYINLANAEQELNQWGQASALARKTLQLYESYNLPDDVVTVEAYSILGTSAASEGLYYEAIKYFRKALDLCSDRLGPDAGVTRSTLLLNEAAVYKSQGDLPRAASLCKEARDLYGRVRAGPEDEEYRRMLDTAQASLYATQGDLDDAHKLAPDLVAYWRGKQGREGGTWLVTALHCEALYRLMRRDYRGATGLWAEVRDIHRKGANLLLEGRACFFLGLTEEVRKNWQGAERLYDEALTLRGADARAFPVNHFIILWRRAGVMDQLGRKEEARDLMEKAVAVAEAARPGAYGGAQQRSLFFAQFAPCFDQAVNFYVRQHDVESAVVALTRGRSRALLDQLHLAGGDPLGNLAEADRKRLLPRESALQHEIDTIQAAAQSLDPDSPGDQARVRVLARDLARAKQEHADVWEEIFSASQPYHEFKADDLSPRSLRQALRGTLVPPKSLLLVYHIGRTRSHLLIVGGRGVGEAYRLKVPASLAGRAKTLDGQLAAARGSRGIKVKPAADMPSDEPPDPGPPAPADRDGVDLTEEDARALVDQYCEKLSLPWFKPNRGIRIKPVRPNDSIPVQPVELLANVFLPQRARDFITGSGARRLIVVPDGALHKLPLEALVVEPGPRPVYAVDELPPIVYAPSVGVLALLASRPRPAGIPRSLLTVCDPEYPQRPAAYVVGTSRGGNESDIPGLSRLAPLPLTASESDSIGSCFAPKDVKQLRGPNATVANVKKNVLGKRFLHLAAHAFADPEYDNLYGAVALTPSAGDNGFLPLKEIYRLPLRGSCDLAVLSACDTNVGPQRSLEAGATIASGFLAAGAHRVIASHWPVYDESTAALMTAFFKGVTADWREGRDPDYALALKKARLSVRDNSQWSNPYYWAPFSLIGSPD